MINLVEATPPQLAMLAQQEAQASAYPWSLSALRTSVEAGSTCYIFQRNTTVLGYALLQINEAVQSVQAELLNFVVFKDHQQRGNGLAAMQSIYQHLKAQSVTEVFLEVRATNIAAQSIYRACGFEQIDVRKNYYPVQEAKQKRQQGASAGEPVVSCEDALCMRLVLT